MRLARSLRRRSLHALKVASDAVFGTATVILLRALRWSDPERMARIAGRTLRTVGPLLKEHRIGRTNLAAAFPEKSAAEIEAILLQVWENLGRFAAEFAHLDRIWQLDPEHPERGRIEVDQQSIDRFLRLRDDGQGALIFAAHLANWELPALAGPAYGLESAVVFRPPNLAAAERAVERIRALNMGIMVPTELDAPLRVARLLESGVHVGMLVDQHYGRGVEVSFFGRTTKCNPLLARLAAQVECPIHGVRIVRLPAHRFRIELSEAIEPVRDADGRLDVQGTMQTITTVVEGWVREHPEQWLWLHRRWR